MIFPGMAPTYVRLGKRAQLGGQCLLYWGPHEHSQVQLPWRSRTSVPSGGKSWPLLAMPICRTLSTQPPPLAQIQDRGRRFTARSLRSIPPVGTSHPVKPNRTRGAGSSQALAQAPGTSPALGPIRPSWHFLSGGFPDNPFALLQLSYRQLAFAESKPDTSPVLLS